MATPFPIPKSITDSYSAISELLKSLPQELRSDTINQNKNPNIDLTSLRIQFKNWYEAVTPSLQKHHSEYEVGMAQAVVTQRLTEFRDDLERAVKTQSASEGPRCWGEVFELVKSTVKELNTKYRTEKNYADKINEAYEQNPHILSSLSPNGFLARLLVSDGKGSR
ncbi:hypothetical protein BJ508DRAFT_343802 [Ascobolus immersus RN42]|uniref:Uncharacterized protein n=1 Tax=Ascobolus immersus RN42 TaxID=1160509 RepID=A0A3N4HIB0_ASCIM|nr:hypothetical protein BJ508DRAFT_343802 [Ascobolus immersus RN42]